MGCFSDDTGEDDKYLSILQMIELGDNEIKRLGISGEVHLIVAGSRDYSNEAPSKSPSFKQDGKYLRGSFGYVIILSSGKTTSVSLKINNGKVENSNITENTQWEIWDDYNLFEISKLKIDSTDAYEIAIESDMIKDFISKGEKYNVYNDLCELKLFTTYDTPYYLLTWKYFSDSSTSKTAWIHISAETGEFLDGEAYDR